MATGRLHAKKLISETNVKQRVVIAGGSGFRGVSLALHLDKKGFEVTVLSRNRPKLDSAGSEVWDGRSLGEWTVHLDGAAAVVNLAGRTVDCIKSADHRDEILRSRVESTRVLGAAMRAVKSPPAVWVQMSTRQTISTRQRGASQTRCYQNPHVSLGH